MYIFIIYIYIYIYITHEFILNIFISVDGKWSEWAKWSSCTKTCGGGTRERKRNCQQPKFGGLSCQGNKKQIQKCNMQSCLSKYLFVLSFFVKLNELYFDYTQIKDQRIQLTSHGKNYGI